MQQYISKQEYKFKKDLSFLRSWILSAGWFEAHRALEYAHAIHIGYRKDGVTPEFHHQVEIALQGRTLHKDLLKPEQTITVAFLHDIREDFGIDYQVIENNFGKEVEVSVELITKKFKGSEKSYDYYFSQLAKDPVASIVKGLDRIHNVSTMKGVFSNDKIKSYTQEIDDYFLPMLKEARRRFPEQELAYMNITNYLKKLKDVYVWA